jgi:serine/threonine kinase 38
MEESSENNNNLSSLDELVKKGTISQSICDKVKLGSSIIEKKYYDKENQHQKYEKIYNTIITYFNNITYLSYLEKEEIKKNLFKKISKYGRISRQKISENRFEVISEIGNGGFGKVRLCRDIKTNEFFAMKKLKFDLLINKAQLFHINTEKEIMALDDNNIWKAKLRYSFINNGYLYFIMDYYPGGDLLHYMNKKDTLTEDEAKFYIAEIILAVDSLHKNKCIHRDIKPDNIFIDQKGHLKLGDFGLSILSSKITYPYTYSSKKYLVYDNPEEFNYLIGLSNVGSLLYVAPEVVEKKIYGAEVDWWSVGVIFYEMLIGFPPFWNNKDSPKETCIKLKNFKKYLNIPKGVKISLEAKKLIFDFLSEREKRLGKNGIEEIKNHIFFKNFDWDNIRDMKPPYVPKSFKYDKDKYKYKFMKRKSLQFYTSKENVNKNIFEIRQKKEEEKELKRINLNFYNFDYNKELVELKYNIENNIVDLIKSEIEIFTKNNNKSVNITLEDTSTEEIASLKSNESSKKKNTNTTNTNLNKSYFSTDIKNKINNGFDCLDKINRNLKRYKTKIFKKPSIKIIPVKNIINNKHLLNKTMYDNDMWNRRNNSYLRKDSRSTHSTAKEYSRKNSEEKKIQEQSKTLAHNKKYKNANHGTRGMGSKMSNDYDTKTLKLNGKLIMIKKNLGKYLLNQ